MKLTPNITLSTGRIITHAFMTNGAQSANILGDESATMTEAEWDEYCELLKGVRNPPVTHVIAGHAHRMGGQMNQDIGVPPALVQLTTHASPAGLTTERR
jgi:hypothetical protein